MTPTVSPIDSQTLSVSQSQPSQQPRSEHNPWLSRNGQSSYATLKKSEIAVSKDSNSAVKAKNKLRKRQKETENEAANVQDDAVVEISPADLLVGSSKNSRRVGAGDDDSDGAGEVEGQEERLKRKGKPQGRSYKAIEQKELVTKAFAGDNVVEVCVYLVSARYHL